MTALIFVTETDASPVIYLDAPPDEVREWLAYMCAPGTLDALKEQSCSTATVVFLRSLSVPQVIHWEPQIESIPVLGISDLDLENMEDDPIAWNPETWSEWPLTLPSARCICFNSGAVYDPKCPVCHAAPAGWTHVETSVEPEEPEEPDEIGFGTLG